MITISLTAGESSSASSPKGAQGGPIDRSGQRRVVDNATRARSGSIGFGNILIRDEDDFNRHVDYLHWNPVKHGYVREMKDWLYSSFDRYVKRGVLPLDWGRAYWVGRAVRAFTDGDISIRRNVARGRALRLLPFHVSRQVTRMSYEWRFRPLFIDADFLQCPHCHLVSEDHSYSLRDIASAMPCCGATGEKHSWPEDAS